jgi:hypothetical protein
MKILKQDYALYNTPPFIGVSKKESVLNQRYY